MRTMNLNVKHTYFVAQASGHTIARTAHALKLEYMHPKNAENDMSFLGKPEIHGHDFWDAHAVCSIAPDTRLTYR